MQGRAALLLAGLLFLASPGQAFPLKLPPVDECRSAPGLTAFRDRLAEVVAKKDSKALLALLADDVLINFGGEDGPQAFAETWALDRPGKSDLWPLLTKILRLGCVPSGKKFAIPSLTMQFEPDADEDLFDIFVVISANAALRSGLAAGSRVIGHLAWDVVKAIDQSGGAQTKIELQDGRQGWVDAEQLYNPASYRLFMEKRGGKWMITALVAGD